MGSENRADAWSYLAGHTALAGRIESRREARDRDRALEHAPAVAGDRLLARLRRLLRRRARRDRDEHTQQRGDRAIGARLRADRPESPLHSSARARLPPQQAAARLRPGVPGGDPATLSAASPPTGTC